MPAISSTPTTTIPAAIPDADMDHADIGEPAAKTQRTMLPVTCEEEQYVEFEEEFEYYDEDTRLPLPKSAVEQAMREELAEFEKHEVGEEVSLEQCHQVTGAPPVSCRWRIHNKGDS